MALLSGVWAYLKERFPVVNTLLFAILFLTVYAVACYAQQRMLFSDGFLFIDGGILATISFFFRLRVFDEIKDFSIDCINHPQRVLQSGRITLTQLQWIAALLFIAEALWTITAGTMCLLCWIVATAYSILMRYEFFASAYLKKRLLLYAFTHMLIMPMIIAWLWWGIMVVDGWNDYVWLLCLLSIAGGFSFEIARKIHAPEAEKVTIDSYSKSLGLIASIILVNILLALGVATQFVLLHRIHAKFWAYGLIAILFLSTLIFYIRIIAAPSEKMFRKVEVLVSLFMLVSYTSVIIQIATTK